MKFYDSGELRASKDWPYAVVAGCLVYRRQDDDTEVLLLSRTRKTDPASAGGNPHSYHLPKGHCKVGEALEHTARRETKEEAAVNANIMTYLGALTWKFDHPRDIFHAEKTSHYFAALWLGDEGSLDDEHDGLQWVGLEDAEVLLGPPNPKGEDEIVRRLKKFLDLEDAA